MLGTLVFSLLCALVYLRPRLVTNHRKSVLFLVGLLSLFSVTQVFLLEPPYLSIAIDPSSESLIPAREPGKVVYAEAIAAYGSDDVYVIAEETDDVFTYENLTVLSRITDRIRQLPRVRNAESLVNTYSFYYDFEQDFVDVGPFIDEIPQDPAELADLRARALADPLYRKVLLSEDGRSTAINVTFEAMSDGEFVELDLDGRIHQILVEESTDGRKFFVTGRPHIRSQAHHLMVGDLITLIPLAILVAASVVWIMTSSPRGVLIPMLNCMTATLWTFGLLAWLDMDLNVMTLVLGPTLICVGSVYGVHVLSRYEAIAASSADPQEAALNTLEYTKVPVLIAGFTTAVGFGALLLGDIPATNELGAFCVFGVAAVTLLSLTTAPAILGLLPLETGALESEEPIYAGRRGLSPWIGHKVDGLLEWLGRNANTRPTANLIFWVLITAGTTALIPRIVIDTDFLTFFKADSQVRTDFDAVNRLVTGAGVLYVTFWGEEEGTFREPETLRALEKIQHTIERIDGVSEVISIVDFITLVNGAFENEPPEVAGIPDTRQAVAETVFMVPKDQMRYFATSNHSGVNLVVRTGWVGSAATRELENSIREAVANGHVPPGITTAVTGNTILLNKSADGIAGNQFTIVGSAAATIFIMMVVVFRSLRLALLAMVPNIFPVLIFFGILGGGLAALSLPTGLIGAITLGIAIDGTMHYIVSYQRDRRAGRSPEESVSHVTRTVGRPIFIGNVMLFVGFNVMLLSEFVTLGQFGYLAAMTMAICTSTDLGLLPALLVRFRI
jgi:predicted RND superfamily exporter protein